MAVNQLSAVAIGLGGGNQLPAIALSEVVLPPLYVGYALALDFDSPSYWVGGTNYALLSSVPGYSFTRSGEQGAADSDGGVDFFAANTPAINGNGYHAYGALTNQLLRSKEFDNASWSKTNVTATADTTVAPDGTTTADTLNAGVANAAHYIVENLTVALGAITYSVFVKQGTGRYVQLLCDLNGAFDAGVTFDLQTGTVTQTSAGWTGYIVALANGWYRLIGVLTASSTNSNAYIVIANSGTPARAPAFLGASETFFAWQAQALEGNFPDGGPAIATAGATAAIGASALSVSDTPANADQLIWANANISGYGTGNQRLAAFTDGTANNRIDLFFAANIPTVQVVTGGVSQLNQTGAAAATGAITLVLQRSGGNWRAGKVVAGVLTWFGAATAGSKPTTTALAPAMLQDSTAQLEDALKGTFRKAGTFPTDADVLAAVAETA